MGTKLVWLNRRRGAVIVAAAIGASGLAATAQATYAGHDGALAYEIDRQTDGGAGSFDGISSIPSRSKANCQNGGLCSIGRISYSPDGRQIVADRDDNTSQLEVLDASGVKVTILRAQTQDDEDPAFLPGGRTIVFDGKRGGQVNIYEVSTDGAGLRRLTRHGGSWPAPCANGTIAFVNDSGLYLMHADGSHVRRLAGTDAKAPHLKPEDQPDCAPNSRSIVYSAANGTTDIISTTQGQPKALSAPNGAETPIFSPDGREVAFTAQIGAEDDLTEYLIVETTGGRRISKRDVTGSFDSVVGDLAWQPKP